MTDDILARAEHAMEGVTDGPWEAVDEPGFRDFPWRLRKIVHPNEPFHELNVLKVRVADNARHECCWPPTSADAAFIARARTLVPDRPRPGR